MQRLRIGKTNALPARPATRHKNSYHAIRLSTWSQWAERAVNAAAGLSRVVLTEHVFPSAEGPGPVANDDELESLQSQLHAVRGRIVQAALRRTGWNVSETARRLDIARSYLYKLVEAHDIQRDE